MYGQICRVFTIFLVCLTVQVGIAAPSWADHDDDDDDDDDRPPRSGQPPAPTGVDATDDDPEKIRVTWSNVRQASYLIFRNTVNSTSGAQRIGNRDGQSFDDRSATPGQIYFYFVKARRRGEESAFSDSDSGIRPLPQPPPPQPPPAPGGVDASDNDPARVRITWNAVSGASYKLFRNTVDTTTGAQQIAVPAGTSFDDTGATPGQTFFYFVKARRDNLDSVFSAGDSGRRPLPPPPPPQPAPDLSVGVTASSASVLFGQAITIAARIGNLGNATAATTSLAYRLSNDNVISNNDTLLASVSIPGIAAGAFVDDSTAVVLPNVGNFFLGACVGVVVGESDPNNNCSAAVPLEVLVPSPDRPELTQVVAALLPSSRSGQVGRTVTVAATIANAGPEPATGCRIDPPASLAADFAFRPTDPVSNVPIGANNQATDVDLGGNQTFVLAITPTQALAPTELAFSYACVNAAPAASVVGVNTLLLSATEAPVPDIVALAATPDGTGSVEVPITGSAVFAVATSNLGASATITARVSPRPSFLPLGFSICQTESITGACVTAPGGTVTTVVPAGATPAFAIFVAGLGQQVPFDPANSRIAVEFVDDGGVVRGSTSVAVHTLGDAPPPPPPPPPPPSSSSEVPDLAVSGIASSVFFQEVNRTIALTATVGNQGSGPAGTSTARHFITTDPNLMNNVTELAAVSVSALAPGASVDLFTPVSTPAQPGTYFYFICVDAVAAEQNNTNNCTAGVEVNVVADGGRD